MAAASDSTSVCLRLQMQPVFACLRKLQGSLRRLLTSARKLFEMILPTRGCLSQAPLGATGLVDESAASGKLLSSASPLSRILDSLLTKAEPPLC